MSTNKIKCTLGFGGLRLTSGFSAAPKAHSNRIFSVLLVLLLLLPRPCRVYFVRVRMGML